MTPVRLLRVTGDDALACRAARGDHEAFGVLFGRYQLRLELYCRSIVRHDEDARDAAQNAMTKAFVALQGREQDVAVRAWLFRIAHNESISLMRRRRPTAELGEDVPETAAAAAAPAEAFELREELSQVLDGVRELPPRARQALLLRELADLDYAAVGQVLGITAGGARQAVFEARTALQADRAGRDAPCDSIRRELSEADHRRRPTRQVRGHLRGCDGCRTWSRAQETRRERLSVLPGAGLAGGSLWAWLTGALGLGAGGGAATIGSGGLALNAKVAASLAALAAGTAPVAVHEVERRLHTEPRPAAEVASAATPQAAPTATPEAPASPNTTRETATTVASTPAAARVVVTTGRQAAGRTAAAEESDDERSADEPSVSRPGQRAAGRDADADEAADVPRASEASRPYRGAWDGRTRATGQEARPSAGTAPVRGGITRPSRGGRPSGPAAAADPHGTAGPTPASAPAPASAPGDEAVDAPMSADGE